MVIVMVTVELPFYRHYLKHLQINHEYNHQIVQNARAKANLNISEKKLFRKDVHCSCMYTRQTTCHWRHYDTGTFCSWSCCWLKCCHGVTCSVVARMIWTARLTAACVSSRVGCVTMWGIANSTSTISSATWSLVDTPESARDVKWLECWRRRRNASSDRRVPVNHTPLTHQHQNYTFSLVWLHWLYTFYFGLLMLIGFCLFYRAMRRLSAVYAVLLCLSARLSHWYIMSKQQRSSSSTHSTKQLQLLGTLSPRPSIWACTRPHFVLWAPQFWTPRCRLNTWRRPWLCPLSKTSFHFTGFHSDGLNETRLCVCMRQLQQKRLFNSQSHYCNKGYPKGHLFQFAYS